MVVFTSSSYSRICTCIGVGSIVGELYSSEVVEEEQDTQTDADGVGDFQGGIAGCGLTCYLGVDLLEKGGNVYVAVKGHNGKACTEKGGEVDEDDFAPSYNNIDSSFFLVGDDEIWFSHMSNIQVWFFGLDIVYGFFQPFPEGVSETEQWYRSSGSGEINQGLVDAKGA